METVKHQGFTVSYDEPSDTLFLDVVKPYSDQRIETVADDVIARLNPSTGEVETLELHHYMARLQAGESVTVPVQAELRLPKAS